MNSRARFRSGIFFLLLALSSIASACPTCTADAASADPHTQRGLRRGILVLLLPAVGVLAGMGVMAYKHRNG